MFDETVGQFVFRVEDARHFVFSNDKDSRWHDGGRRPHANRLAGHASFSKKVPGAKDRHDRFLATLIYDRELQTSSLDIHDAIFGVPCEKMTCFLWNSATFLETPADSR